MDTRYMYSARRRARGAVRPVILAVVVVVVLLAAAAWFLIFMPHQELVAADNGGHPSTPVTVDHVAAASGRQRRDVYARALALAAK